MAMRQNLKSLATADRIALLAPEESQLFLLPPPFRTVREKAKEPVVEWPTEKLDEPADRRERRSLADSQWNINRRRPVIGDVRHEEMTEEEIRACVAEMDTTDSRRAESAWLKIRHLDQGVVPFLAEAFPAFRKWQGRVALVFHAIRYARSSDIAFQLGLAALQDRATLERSRRCHWVLGHTDPAVSCT